MLLWKSPVPGGAAGGTETPVTDGDILCLGKQIQERDISCLFCLWVKALWKQSAWDRRSGRGRSCVAPGGSAQVLEDFLKERVWVWSGSVSEFLEENNDLISFSCLKLCARLEPLPWVTMGCQWDFPFIPGSEWDVNGIFPLFLGHNGMLMGFSLYSSNNAPFIG